MGKFVWLAACTVCAGFAVAVARLDTLATNHSDSGDWNPWNLCASGDSDVQSTVVSYSLGLHMLPRTTLVYSFWKHSDTVSVIVESAAKGVTPCVCALFRRVDEWLGTVCAFM
jgi:hypothetical protein